MPSFKGFSRNLLSRTKSSNSATSPTPPNGTTSPIPDLRPLPDDDSPEGSINRAIRLFCESGSTSNQGEEVLFLPTIVDAAESSPSAAAAGALQIRKFLHKDNQSRPHVQYNSIMLLRILSENPGPSFTRNIDRKFVDTVASLLQKGKDPSVQQIMRETLDALEAERASDPGLKKLLEMWRVNRGNAPRHNYNHQYAAAMQASRASAQAQSRSGLPSPSELSTRVEESKNSAKILLQLVQSTPPEDVLSNDLVKEFAERCQAAQRSMQGFIACEDPAPDDDTLQTLIETSEQLSLSLSRHQRAVLSARRALGVSASNNASPAPEQTPYRPTSRETANVASQQPNYLTSTTPPLQAIPSLAPEPRYQQSQFEPPPVPPPKSSRSEQQSSLDPFADSAEQSNYGGDQARYAGAQEASDRQQPPREPVTYRY